MVENSVDPDQRAWQEASRAADLNLIKQCFTKKNKSEFSWPKDQNKTKKICLPYRHSS